MQNFRASGAQIDVVLADTVKGGSLCIIGALAGIAATDSDGIRPTAVHLKGAYTLKKETDKTFTAGQKAYFKADTQLITTTASGNTLVGVAFADAATGDFVDILLTNAV